MSKKKVTNNSSGQRPAGGLSGPMDVGLLERIVKLMAANDLNTVDVRDGDKRVILKRGAATPTSVTYSASPASGHATAAPPAAIKASTEIPGKPFTPIRTTISASNGNSACAT